MVFHFTTIKINVTIALFKDMILIVRRRVNLQIMLLDVTSYDSEFFDEDGIRTHACRAQVD